MEVRFSMADKNGRPISPEQFFGLQDARRVDKAIHLIYLSAVARLYTDCYNAPYMGPITYMQAHGSADGYLTYRKSWYNAHPGEREKELESRRKRDEELAKAFRTVYGIANRRGYYIEWEGQGCACEADRWKLYRNHKLVAYIQM